jgi:ribosomal protein S6
MKNYQLVLVLRSSVTDANRKKFLETVKSWLKDTKFTKEEEWGERPFSYQIKRESTGFYLNILLESKNSLSSDFEKRLHANEDVLRHLLLRVN